MDEVIEARRGAETKYFHSLHFPILREEESPLEGGLMIDVTEQVEAQDEVRRQAEQLRRTVEGAVLAMSQVVETRDPYTAGHERRVAELATAHRPGDWAWRAPSSTGCARRPDPRHRQDRGAGGDPRQAGPPESGRVQPHQAALAVGLRHPAVIDFGWPVAEMVLQHHERLDGSGYPRGLAAGDLLPETLILAVADVVEAMSSHRPYRAALGTDAALAEIREGAGTRYDAGVAAACERVIVQQGFRFTP